MENKYFSLDEIQCAEYKILKKFHDFCEMNKLKYYLAGGTLLGAVRHKGFIPWDDDIDVIMPRPDMMRMLELAKDGISDDYLLDTKYYNKKTPTTMTKIYDKRTQVEFSDMSVPYDLGVWIDVTAADGVSSSKVKRRLDFICARILLDLTACVITKLGTERRTKFLTKAQWVLMPFIGILRAIGYRRYNLWLERLSMQYDYDSCPQLTVYEGRGGINETMDKQDVFPLQLIQFGDSKFYAPANCDKYLTNMYGEYMKLPPLEKQIPKHIMKVKKRSN